MRKSDIYDFKKIGHLLDSCDQHIYLLREFEHRLDKIHEYYGNMVGDSEDYAFIALQLWRLVKWLETEKVSRCIPWSKHKAETLREITLNCFVRAWDKEKVT